MKKIDREKYFNVTGAMGCGLCVCCKYAKGEGSICSEDGYIECQHPIWKVQDADEYGDVSDGSKDCWAFRPMVPFEDLVTIASYVLEYGWDEWQWDYSKKKNNIRIQTIKQQVIFPSSKTLKR